MIDIRTPIGFRFHFAKAVGVLLEVSMCRTADTGSWRSSNEQAAFTEHTLQPVKEAGSRFLRSQQWLLSE